MIAMKDLVGESDFLFITLDTLRYDAAQQAWKDGRLKTLGAYLGSQGWEKRHSPGNFTYAAHHAFFAGFLPTPLGQGPHPRLFAADFGGSLSTADGTYTFKEATLPEALTKNGYHTICIGGTEFFNQQTALSRALPSLFTEPLRNAGEQRCFLFVNVAAIHQPNWFYGKDGTNGKVDNLETHTDALVAVDDALEPLFECFGNRGRTFSIVCSDHGTAYGEDGYSGHRLGHEVVWTVPYADFMIEGKS